MADENDDTSEGTSVDDNEPDTDEEGDVTEVVNEGGGPDNGEPLEPVGVPVGNPYPPPGPLAADVAEPVDERLLASMGVNTSIRPVSSVGTMTEPEPAPTFANAAAEVDLFLQELVASVDKDIRQAEELSVQLAHPTLAKEEKQQLVPVLDPISASIMKAVARGDHAGAAALLQDTQAESKKNEIYRIGDLNKIGLRIAKGPLDRDARGVKEVARPKPEQAWNRPVPARTAPKPDEQAGPSDPLPRVPVSRKVADMIEAVEERERRINLPDIQLRKRHEQPPRQAGLGPGAQMQPQRPLGHFAQPLDRYAVAPPQVSSAKPRSRVITRALPTPNNVNKNVGRFL